MKIFNVKAILIGSLIFNSFSVMALDQQIIQQKAREAQVWLINNKKKIISLGLAISAILGTGYLAGKAQPKLRVVEVFREKKVLLPEDLETRNSVYRLGLLAAEKGIEGLKELVSTSETRGQLAVMLQAYPNLAEALAELAGVTAEDIHRIHYLRRKISLN